MTKLCATRSSKHNGFFETLGFIALILREPFDYTKWRQTQFEDKEIAEISAKAMKLRRQSGEKA